MTRDVQKEIKDLSAFFNASASLYYRPDHKENSWSVTITGVHLCHLANSFFRNADGTHDKVVRASQLTGYGATIEEAIDKILADTTQSGRPFMISNESFGGWGDDSDSDPLITPYENNQKQPGFRYFRDGGEQKARDFLLRHAP